MIGGQFYGMSEEEIKKNLICQVFFLVGPNFSSSEDSSTVEYSECALRCQWQKNNCKSQQFLHAPKMKNASKVSQPKK